MIKSKTEITKATIPTLNPLNRPITAHNFISPPPMLLLNIKAQSNTILPIDNPDTRAHNKWLNDEDIIHSTTLRVIPNTSPIITPLLVINNVLWLYIAISNRKNIKLPYLI